MYSFNLENIVPSGGLAYLIAKATVDESNKWYRRLSHVNIKNLNKLVKGNLVRGLPSNIFQNDHAYVACQKGKQHKALCKANIVSSISQRLQLLHMDLFGPTSVRSINHKTYCLVIIDDFSRDIIEFRGSKGIKREYSNVRTSQQNGVAERKYRSHIEAARTMLADSFLPNTFWAEAPVRSENQANKTAGPEEANHSAGTQDNINARNSEMEADPAQDYFILPIYSSYNSIVKSSEAKNEGEKPNKDTDLKTNEEPVDQEDQAFLEELERLKRQEKEANDAAEALRKDTASSSVGPSYPDLTNYVDQDDSQILALEDIYGNSNDGSFTNASYDYEGVVTDFTNLESTVNVSPIPTSKIHSIHPITQILGDPKLAVQTRSKVNKSSRAHAFEELLQFKIQKVWILVDLPFRKKAIGTKWVYRNKKDERGVVIEAIRIFLAFSSYMGFIVYQIDVKSAFLYGTIDEEVYVSQPPGFVDLKFPKKVYRVVKALYGLHQAPRAWYATLSTFLLKNGYERGTINKTLFIKKDKNDIMLVHMLKPLTMDEEVADVDAHLYKYVIGSLMYLTASRPDIMFAYGLLYSFLRDTYGAELVSAASLINTVRPKLLLLGLVGAAQKKSPPPLFDSRLVPHQAHKGEGSEQPTEPQPTPSPTQPSTVDQLPVTDSSFSHDTTQDSRDSLEGTNRSEGDQVQPSYDSNLSGGPTSDRAKGGMTLEELYVLCINLLNRVLALEASKDAQAEQIIKLKTRIKKLKKKSHPTISHHRA
ncbi:putative ribonuclease H-like domain-containing protein [Tanacetum coccineum]